MEYRQVTQAREREKRRDYYRTHEIRRIRHRLEFLHRNSFSLGETIRLLANHDPRAAGVT
jgi:hypothetical protein